MESEREYVIIWFSRGIECLECFVVIYGYEYFFVRGKEENGIFEVLMGNDGCNFFIF